MFKFKKNLEKIKRISNFKNRTNNILNLDRNEKILPLTNFYKKKFNDYIKNSDLNLYPNLDSTYKKLSRFLKINKENILITEGVSGAIKNLLDSAITGKKIEIIVPEPSFALYKIYAKIYDLKLKKFTYDKFFNLKVNDIFRLVTKKTSIVFLTFPNIPVEGDIKISFIKKLCKFLKKKNILLVVDEVYYPFNKYTTISLIKNFSNLVVMRSFSKAYGLAGARIGYMVSNKDKIKIISNTKGGYETNSLSAKAVHFVLDHHKLTMRYVKDVKKGFTILKKSLDKKKINYLGGVNSNFIFIDLKNSTLSKKIFKRLQQKKIMVRQGYVKPFNKGILLTGCPPKQMRKFILNFNKIKN